MEEKGDKCLNSSDLYRGSSVNLVDRSSVDQKVLVRPLRKGDKEPELVPYDFLFGNGSIN
jgi:hypothetical protein